MRSAGNAGLSLQVHPDWFFTFDIQSPLSFFNLDHKIDGIKRAHMLFGSLVKPTPRHGPG